MEFLLWGLEANKRLNKYRTLEGFQFKDALGSYISGLWKKEIEKNYWSFL